MRLARRDEHRGPNERRPSVSRLLVRDGGGQQILRVEDAGDLVERVVEHREPRVLGAAHAVEHVRPRRRALDADDVDARHHDLVHRRVAEREDAVEDRLLARP